MAGRIRIDVEADITVLAPVDDVGGVLRGLPRHPVGDSILNGGDHIAEDTMLIFRLGSCGRPRIQGGRHAAPGLRLRSGNVAIAPGGPEAVHIFEYSGPEFSGRRRAASRSPMAWRRQVR